jgi:hypothetical protein
MTELYKNGKRAIYITFITILVLFSLIVYFKVTKNNLRFMLYVVIYLLVINIRLYISKLLYKLNCNYNPSNSYFRNLLKGSGTRPDCDAIKYLESMIINQQWKYIFTVTSILFFDLATLKT